ncbi:MAG: putative integral rane protein [Verrucomicrobiaceae bacterium]|nr:putative integral rane protein [Verrucomicrobiaceae bacterium]
MGIIGEIASFLIQSVGGLYLWAILLRFLLQIARADFYNPVSQALVRVTNPLVKPLRRLIPGFFGVDIASLILAWLVKLLMVVTIYIIQTGSLNFSFPLVLAVSLLSILVAVLNIYFLAMIASIIISWVAAGSYHPAVVLLNQLAEPIMAPFRKLLPPMGGIDFSPMLAFLAINVVKILLSGLAMKIGLVPHSFLGMLILNI